tara:strand:+ start:94 stop:564 length:471 start_codon:yes stop_codon:yes gene_type:complete
MKILLSLVFLYLNSLSFAAGTDSDSYSDNSSSSTRDEVEVEFSRAKKEIYKGEYDLALNILESIIDEKPSGYSKADLYNYLGFTSRKQKNPDYKKAEEYYLKALSIDPNHIGALEYLGELYYETNRLDLAKSLLTRLQMVAGQNSEEYKELYELLN